MNTKNEIIDHLLTLMDDTNKEIEEDFALVDTCAKKIIAELEAIMFYSKQITAKRIIEPNFLLLQNELTILVTKFNDANRKKHLKCYIKEYASLIINK